MADKNERYFRIVLAVLVLAIFMAVGYKLKKMYKPALQASATLDRSCDLRKGACRSMLPDGGEVTFSLSPNHIPMLKPLALKVEVNGMDVEKAYVDFVGISVYMGFNRALLGHVQDGRFEGEGMLPVCIDSKMTWEARVMLETAEGLMRVPFEFYTER